ncbi:MAG: NAD(P)/FAD-dependent oxidoreductase [Planctomycetota bacterium]
MTTKLLRQQGCAVDVLVVGAGPAGAVAARGLSRDGANVLLVDAAEFPRWKVCGCCLNGVALAVLSEIGLPDLHRELDARRLRQVRVHARGCAATLFLPDGVALSREQFDSALIAEAVSAGADFRQSTHAKWLHESERGVLIELTNRQAVTHVHASVVIAADGLAAGFTRKIPGVREVHTNDARLGAGVTVDLNSQYHARDQIYMAVGAGGYVGLVRVEDDRLNVAAAFDVRYLRKLSSIGAAANRILEDNKLPRIELLEEARWQGTPPLTRRYEPPPSARLFLIGDAAEYVEPFTGEGMAWALTSGAGVVRYALDAVCDPDSAIQANWLDYSKRQLGRRRSRCRAISRALRYPRLLAIGLRALRIFPDLAGPYISSLNRIEPICR